MTHPPDSAAGADPLAPFDPMDPLLHAWHEALADGQHAGPDGPRAATAERVLAAADQQAALRRAAGGLPQAGPEGASAAISADSLEDKLLHTTVVMLDHLPKPTVRLPWWNPLAYGATGVTAAIVMVGSLTTLVVRNVGGLHRGPADIDDAAVIEAKVEQSREIAQATLGTVVVPKATDTAGAGSGPIAVAASRRAALAQAAATSSPAPSAAASAASASSAALASAASGSNAAGPAGPIVVAQAQPGLATEAPTAKSAAAEAAAPGSGMTAAVGQATPATVPGSPSAAGSPPTSSAATGSAAQAGASPSGPTGPARVEPGGRPAGSLAAAAELAAALPPARPASSGGSGLMSAPAAATGERSAPAAGARPAAPGLATRAPGATRSDRVSPASAIGRVGAGDGPSADSAAASAAARGAPSADQLQRALWMAAAQGDAPTVRRLADDPTIKLNAANGDGLTALILAIAQGDGGPRHQAVVRALLSHDASPNLADRSGTTPLQWAERRGQAEVAALLRAAGAR